MSEEPVRNILIDGPQGRPIVLQLRGRKLLAVAGTKDLVALLTDCPELTRSSKPAATGKEKIMKFFGTGPCYFLGCEELRQEYAQEIEKTITASCPPCKKSAIMRRFIPRIEALLNNTINQP